MPLYLEVRGYKKSSNNPEEVIFDQSDDLAIYNRRRAWDLLPSHRFYEPLPSSGGGSTKIVFDSSTDADTGLTTLNRLKTESNQ